MAENSKPMNSAIANGALSPLATVPITSARAMPIDTAVTATAVDSASAAVVMSSTQATFLSLGVKSFGVNSLAAQTRRASCSSLLRGGNGLNMFSLRESVFQRVREDRRGYRHRFVGSWAKALTNKGDFMFWVNEALTREHFAGRCDSAATRK